MARTVTAKGHPLNLSGTELKVGDRAPDFALLNNAMTTVKLSDSAGQVRLLSVVSSLDTSTCSTQTKTFNDKLATLGEAVRAYTISADLPFAQKRFCDVGGIDKTETLSDHRDMSFGKSYGLLLPDQRLLARAVLVIDKNDIISYMQVVDEVSNEPDYDSALKALKEAIG
ncbi:MAG: thiol peroxidase [candidate division Zixibacteria bacterium]|nr:thiol peroxidase [candidate division Zixibacteria bacterium]